MSGRSEPSSSGHRIRYMTGMVVDSVGNGMYLPVSLLFFHHVTGLPLPRVGFVVTAAALIGLVGNPVAGVLVDRFGARAVVVGVYALRAVGFAAYPLVHGQPQMFAAVTLVALGNGAFPPAVQALVAEIAQGADRDRLIAAQRSLRNAGLGAGGLLAGLVLQLGSMAAFRGTVLASGAAFAVAALLIRGIPTARTSGAHTAAAARKQGGYRAVWRDRPFAALTLLNIPTAFGYTVLSVSLPVYVTQELGAQESMAGVLYAVNTVAIAVLQIPVTRVLARRRRTRAAALGGAVFALSFLAFAALGALSVGTPLLIGVVAATLLFTVGELMHGATASALVASAAPEATRGRHLAVYQLSWSLPTALAPAVLTTLLDLSPTVMWLLLAVGAAGSALGMVRLEPRLPARAVRPGPAVDAPPADVPPADPPLQTAADLHHRAGRPGTGGTFSRGGRPGKRARERIR